MRPNEAPGPVAFVCRQCGAAVTKPLNEVPHPSYSADFTPEFEPTQEGFYFVEDASPPSMTGHFIVHLSDLTGVTDHADARRLAGCCGLDGCDGPNTCCAESHDVGTRRTDCWTWHYAHLDPRLVEARPGI